MITVERKDATVKLTASLSFGWSISFLNTRSCEFDAILLQQKLNEDLEKRIETIRKEAYEQGWRDKSRKVKKKAYFNGDMSSSYIGH